MGVKNIANGFSRDKLAEENRMAWSCQRQVKEKMSSKKRAASS
jgi:hypothetical protein